MSKRRQPWNRTPLGGTPPRRVVRVGVGPRLGSRGELITWVVSMGVTFCWFGGGIVPRVVAMTVGDVVPATAVAVSRHESLKGRVSHRLEVRFPTPDGERQDSFPVWEVDGIGRPDHSPQVAYLPAWPAVSGLVDDFGFTRAMASIFAVLLIVLGGGPVALLVYKLRWQEPRARRLLETGIIVPLSVRPAWLATVWIDYKIDGRPYSKRVARAYVDFAPRFVEGPVAVVDPAHPKRMMIYGAHSLRVEDSAGNIA
ncbi:MAG TPA: hypothetical protein VMY88_00625 [Acidimicrobiales bacterium]|nr:hypothetical protein [Acidimicrobiales bacterium]